MNAERRKKLAAAADKVRRLSVELSEVMQEVIDLRDDEQEYFNNMPEGLQSGERGQAAENAISELDNAIGILETDLNEAADNIDAATE